MESFSKPLLKYDGKNRNDQKGLFLPLKPDKNLAKVACPVSLPLYGEWYVKREGNKKGASKLTPFISNHKSCTTTLQEAYAARALRVASAFFFARAFFLA